MAIPNFDWWRGNTGLYTPGIIEGIVEEFGSMLGLWLAEDIVDTLSDGDLDAWNNHASNVGGLDLNRFKATNKATVQASSSNATNEVDFTSLHTGVGNSDDPDLTAYTSGSVFGLINMTAYAGVLVGTMVGYSSQYTSRHMLFGDSLTNGYPRVAFRNTAAEIATWTGTVAIPMSVWRVVVFTQTGSGFKAFIDGIEQTLVFSDGGDATINESDFLADINTTGTSGPCMGAKVEGEDPPGSVLFGMDCLSLAGGIFGPTVQLNAGGALDLTAYLKSYLYGVA